MNKIFRIVSLVIGLSAILSILISFWKFQDVCFIMTEPTAIIRYTEWGLGLFGIAGLIAILYTEVKDAIPQEKK